ncbi:MAG: type 1 glutamine amidotransferase domain-containing protein [Pseudomonadota bacterium]
MIQMFIFNLVALLISPMAKAKPVVFVITNQSSFEVDGKTKSTGVWLSEFTKPYYTLKDAGVEVELASLNGGRPPIDPRSLSGLSDTEQKYNNRFINDRDLQISFSNTKELKNLKPNNYDAIVFPGGHGPMFDLAKSKVSQTFTRKVYENGGLVGAICHGPAALVDVQLSDGKYLLDGVSATGFTNSEEIAVKLDKEMPFLLETRMRKRGAKFQSAKENFNPKVVADGRIVTAQNPPSAIEFGKTLVSKLKAAK